MNRRLLLTVAAAVCAAPLLAAPVLAHHGWGWATDQEVEITGTVTFLRLGNPHGELRLDVDGATWEVEIGQPWRNARAGLTEARLALGTVVTAHGHRSKNPDVLLLKAERLVIDGTDYDLYPDRAS